MAEKLNLSPEIQRLKNFMEAEGLSSTDLSIASGISETSISRFLTGKTIPRKSNLNRIIEVNPKLNRTLLFTGQGEMFVSNSTKKEDESTKISYAAFKHLEEEVLYLREMLKMAMGNMANFQNSPLQAAKLIEIKGALAGDYKLAA